MTKKLLIAVFALFGAASAFGQNNDFLTDYSLLEPNTEGRFVSLRYFDPNVIQKLADYKAVLVDQPEIFIAADSKYKGAKGDQLKALADVARLATIERLEAGGYTIATEPGPDVLYMRWAITDLYLQKKKRGILSYTPLGMVVHATKSAANSVWRWNYPISSLVNYSALLLQTDRACVRPKVRKQNSSPGRNWMRCS
jgi:hypothetical protein